MEVFYIILMVLSYALAVGVGWLWRKEYFEPEIQVVESLEFMGEEMPYFMRDQVDIFEPRKNG